MRVHVASFLWVALVPSHQLCVTCVRVIAVPWKPCDLLRSPLKVGETASKPLRSPRCARGRPFLQSGEGEDLGKSRIPLLRFGLRFGCPVHTALFYNFFGKGPFESQPPQKNGCPDALMPFLFPMPLGIRGLHLGVSVKPIGIIRGMIFDGRPPPNPAPVGGLSLPGSGSQIRDLDWGLGSDGRRGLGSLPAHNLALPFLFWPFEEGTTRKLSPICLDCYCRVGSLPFW